nr:hypothetical protein [Streptomyces orinoci]
MPGHRIDSLALDLGQLTGELDADRRGFGQLTGNAQGSAGGGDKLCGLVLQATRQSDPVGVGGVEAADKARRLPGGEALVLAAVELRIVERGGVFQRREQLRWKAGRGDLQHGRLPCADDGRGLAQVLPAGLGAQFGCGGGRSGGDGAELVGERFDVGRGQPLKVGEVGELVGVGREGAGVYEDGGPAGPGDTVQWQGDQTAEPEAALGLVGQEVLGGEEPVVAGQGHLPPGVDGAAQERHAQGAGGGGRDRCGEERPDVRAGAGAGDLDQGGDAGFAAGRGVGGGVTAPVAAVLAVEVAGQETAGVIGQHRVQAEVEFTALLDGVEVAVDGLVGERPEHPVRVGLGAVERVVLGRAPAGAA